MNYEAPRSRNFRGDNTNLCDLEYVQGHPTNSRSK